MGRREDVGPPTEVDAGSTVVMKGDHVTGLKVVLWRSAPIRPRQRPLLPIVLQES
jgi:hypothetical protein